MKNLKLKAARAEKGSGRVEAEIWMEEDGLHGTIRNGTSWRLKEGAALCVYGFARIRALAPGENGTMQKCELCLENACGEPACVTGCPNKAIVYEERGDGE